MRMSPGQFFRELSREIFEVSWTLFKIMIPVIVVVKILDALGGIDYLALALGPLMAIVGLPDYLGLVWAATLSTNIYAGLLVFFSLPGIETLSTAQVTILGGMMLMAHGLPIEGAIARKAGIRLRVTLLLRIVGSFLFAALLNLLYSSSDSLQEPASLVWHPAPVDPSLSSWFASQAESLLMVQLIIIALLTLLKCLRLLGVERLISWLLRPVLKLLGIGREATTITLVGITLGLSFGGGLLIKEARSGHIKPQDVFASMCFLGLCHSLIEDTLLIMLIGAHLSGILWFRLIFALLVTALLSRWALNCNPQFKQRHLLINQQPTP